MKKFFTVLFVFMGVLFLLQLIALAYLFIVDPYNLKPILFPADRAVSTTPSSSVNENGDGGVSNNGEPATEASGMTAAQAEALNSVGLDASAAQSFTPEQITCFETLLGAPRVAEIKAGAVPTMAEFYTVRGCM
ncbi:MAG: hypothetical protein UW75_C0005G0014 [Parcubacteria group bacterium GW2011_GWF2_44_8]|nr:MAG: hypothetical protein UW75_C0005G0014 [Parcubacteria group bacterium GW2011_GWF2_44_8]